MNSNWKRVLTLDEEAFKQIEATYAYYNISIQIRKHLAPLLEKSILKDGLDEQNQDHWYSIRCFLVSLKEKIQFLSMANDIELASTMKQALNDLANITDYDLFKYLKHCLCFEKEVVNKDPIFKMISSLEQGIAFSDELLNIISAAQIDVDGYFTEINKIKTLRGSGGYSGIHTENTVIIECNQKINDLMSKVNDKISVMSEAVHKLSNSFKKIALDSTQLISSIVLKVHEWKNEQKEVFFGGLPSIKLNRLNIYFKNSSDIIRDFNNLIDRVENVKGSYQLLNEENNPINFPSLRKNVMSNYNTLLSNGLVITSYPQVVNINNKLSLEVVYLAAPLLINIAKKTAIVKLCLVDQSLMENYLSNGNEDDYKVIKAMKNILNDSKPIVYDAVENHYSAKFTNCDKIDKDKCCVDKSQFSSVNLPEETVAEHKYYWYCNISNICFKTSSLPIHSVSPEEDTDIRIDCTSLPVCRISAGTQEHIATAALIWKYGFDLTTNNATSKSVNWDELISLISKWFKCRTGKGLNNCQQGELKNKMFPNGLVTKVSWDMFCKHPLANGYPFWKWVFKNFKLIKKCFANEWISGKVIGFIGRRTAEMYLEKCPGGTFVIRFTDYQNERSAAICTSQKLLDEDLKKYEEQFLHGLPWTTSELQSKSLSERILELQNLKNLLLFNDEYLVDKTKAFELPKVAKKFLTYATMETKFVPAGRQKKLFREENVPMDIEMSVPSNSSSCENDSSLNLEDWQRELELLEDYVVLCSRCSERIYNK